MNIASMASLLNELEVEIEELSIDMFADKNELIQKEHQKRKILNELLFYDEFEQLYENNKKYDLDSTLLYPYKVLNENNEKIFKRKNSEEYKEDVAKYLEDLKELYENGELDRKTYLSMREEAIELAEKQMERIEDEEKEQEEEIDLDQDYHKILEEIENTKKAFIIHQVGEESYGALCYKYKGMQEIERKELLYKTHTGLCKEMGIKFDMSFTKYDIKDEDTVNNEGYCIKLKDISNIPFPLDTILLEQTYKLYIGQVLQNTEYTPYQKTILSKMLHNSLAQNKNLILDKIKKRELTPYGC